MSRMVFERVLQRARDHMASQIDLTYTGPSEEVPPSALL